MSQLIYTAITKVMGEIGAVKKEGKNAVQGYAFRGIEQMYAAAHPAFIKHGIFCAPEVIDQKTETFVNNKGTTTFRVLLRVAHKFYAADGSWIVVTTSGEGIDTSDKASNKAMSAAMKYALIELFCVPTEDIADSDRDGVTLADTKKQFEKEADVPMHLGSAVKVTKTGAAKKVANEL